MTLTQIIGRFFLKHLAVPKNPKILPGKKLIACIGDSITYGSGVGGKTEKTWEYFLNQQLGEEYQVLNYGISGRTLQDEGDFPYRNDRFYPLSKKCGAETFLIMLGTNDTKPYNWDEARYEKELPVFVKEYLALPKNPSVILMIPPKSFPYPGMQEVAFDIRNEEISGPLRRIVRKTAEELKIPCIDLYALTEERSDWFSDGVHPNEAGNRAIAAFIAGLL